MPAAPVAARVGAGPRPGCTCTRTRGRVPGTATPESGSHPRQPATLHLPTLLFASVATMAASAALMTEFGLTQRIYRLLVVDGGPVAEHHRPGAAAAGESHFVRAAGCQPCCCRRRSRSLLGVRRCLSAPRTASPFADMLLFDAVASGLGRHGQSGSPAFRPACTAFVRARAVCVCTARGSPVPGLLATTGWRWRCARWSGPARRPRSSGRCAHR